MSQRYVLLDRDGTINVDTHYLSCPNSLALLPGVIIGLRQLQAMGFKLIVLTNQSGVARGYFDMNRVSAIHIRLATMLAAEGITLSRFYVCPHKPRDGCVCRKPRPGLVEQACSDYSFEPSKAYMIGDKASDIALGQTVGMKTILVRTGHGAEVELNRIVIPDFVANTIVEAAALIKSIQPC